MVDAAPAPSHSPAPAPVVGALLDALAQSQGHAQSHALSPDHGDHKEVGGSVLAVDGKRDGSARAGAGAGAGAAPEWQKMFEDALQLPSRNKNERLKKAQALKAVSEAFSAEAKKIGKIIVQESTLPEEKRTFKPLSGKGIGALCCL